MQIMATKKMLNFSIFSGVKLHFKNCFHKGIGKQPVHFSCGVFGFVCQKLGNIYTACTKPSLQKLPENPTPIFDIGYFPLCTTGGNGFFVQYFTITDYPELDSTAADVYTLLVTHSKLSLVSLFVADKYNIRVNLKHCSRIICCDVAI